MKKWIVPSLLALALCLCLLPTNAAADTPNFNDGTWTKLTAELLSSNNYTLRDGKYYLNDDVYINDTIIMECGSQPQQTKNITLDLNGHTLAQTTKTASVIETSFYVVLTIQDSSTTKTGKITSAATADSCPNVGGIYVGAQAIVEMTGGTIEGCWGKKAGAVHVYSSGKFTMTGGTITGCHGVGDTDSSGKTMDLYAGGVCVDGTATDTDSFTMTGGTIEKCFSNDSTGGANLAVRTSIATINGSAKIGEGYGTSDNNKNYAVKLYSGTVKLADSAKIESTYSVYVSAGTLNGADGGTVTGAVLNRGTITGGTYTGTVTNYGTINNSALGSGTGKVINCGTISGGSIQDAISWKGGIIDETTIGSETVDYRWKVSFDSNGGSAIDPVLCDKNGKATKPADPTRDGWSLYGWFTDKDCKQEFDFNTPLTEDTTLYAGWARNISSGDELVNWYGIGNVDTGVGGGHWEYDYQGGRYLRITNDFTLSASVTFTLDITLDLNGHTIWCSDNAAIQVGKGENLWECEVTITDRSGKTVSDQLMWANVNDISTKWTLLTVKQGNTLYLKNGTLRAVAVDGEFQMTGGTVKGRDTVPAVTVNSGGSFIQSGGTVTNDSTTTSDGTSVQVEGGSFTLSGGTVKNTVKVSGTMNADGGTAAWAEIASGGKITQSSDASKTTEFTGTVTNSGTIEAGVYRGVVTGGTVTGGLFYNPDNRTGDILTRSNFNNSYRVSFQANGKPYAVAVVPSGSTAPELASLGADAYGRKWLGWFTGDSSTAFDFATGITSDLTLTARWDTDEKETGAAALTRGQTYYFDLSAYLAEGDGQLPGTVNSGDSDGNESLPDTTLHYVPFTYAGQVQTYALASASSNKVTATRILFMADANLVNTVSWDALNAAGYIYGKNYTANGVTYTLRAPTGGNTDGDGKTEPSNALPGKPENNDWDALLSKETADNGKDYIKLRAPSNYNMGNFALTQDTMTLYNGKNAAIRRDNPNVGWATYGATDTEGYGTSKYPVGYRPVLELKDKADAKNLAVVTLDLNGGTLDGQSTVKLVVKSGENATYTAPSATGLTRPSGNTGDYLGWLDKSTGKLHAPGAAVPAAVTTLTAQWVQTFTINYTDGKDGAIFTTQSYSAQDGTNTPAFTGTDLNNVPSWTFTGWSPSVATTVTGDATYTAQWETKNANTLVLDGNGGTRTERRVEYSTYTQQSGGDYCTLDYASEQFKRKGYTLLGWQKQNDTDTTLYKKGDKVYFTAIHNGETITLYAQWELDTYTITFKYVEGATFPNGTVLPTEYTVLDSVTLPTPSKTGFTFGGWFLNEAFSGKAATSIPTGTTGNKTYRAKWTPVPYTITYSGVEGATNTNPATYTIESDTFALSAPTREGYAFLGWTWDGQTTPQTAATIEKGSTGSRTYTANWKQLYTVTFDPGGGTLAEAERTAQTDISDRLTLTTLPTPTRSGYRFSGWYTAASGGEQITLETVYAANTTVYAQWTYIPVSSGSSGTVNITVPVSSDHATVDVKAEVTQGNAKVEVSDAQIKQVAADGAGAVTVDVSSLQNVTSATVPSHVVEKTNEAEDTALTVALPAGSVSLDETALESVTEAADGKDVTISVVAIPTTNIAPVVKDIIGMEPSVVAVVDVNITVNGVKKSSFDGGKVTISVPYTPKKGEDTSKLTVWFIRDDGTIESKGGWYDAKNKCFVFETEHLSQYVLLNAPTAFTDVPVEKYFYPAVNWAVANSITGGTTATTFSPYASCTRGQLVTFLWRAAGKPEAKSTVNPFSDVKETSAFYKAILWAAENGIVTGYADGTFRPGASVTRQQTAAILYRYAKFAGMDTTQGGMLLREFSDYESVSSYALSAMGWAVNTGVVTGNKGCLLPHDTCTRAQIVTMLYRLLAK